MATFEEEKANFLSHYGVPGMKWGKKRNANYSDQQIKRDTQVYGRRGASRINKNMNKGDQISTARGAEKTRRDKVMGRNKYARQAGKFAGAVGGVALANVALTQLNRAANTMAGRTVVNKVFGSVAGEHIRQGLVFANGSPIVRAAASVGAAKVGSMLAGDLGVSVNMRTNGYDPNRR